MSRCTCEVPPAMPAALLHNHCRAQGPASADDGSRPGTRSAASDSPCVMAVHVSLTQLDSGPGSSPRPSRVRVRRLCRRSTWRSIEALRQRVSHQRIIQRAVAPSLLVQAGQVRLVHDLLLEREVRATLVRQGGSGHRPPLPLDAHDVLRRHEDVGQEDLVELGVARHLHERAHVDARVGHVDDQRGDPLLGPRRVGVGAGQAEAPGGELRVGGPDLAARHLEAPVDRRGPCGERGQVAPGVGLAEELTPDLLGREDRPACSAAAGPRCRGPAASGPPG